MFDLVGFGGDLLALGAEDRRLVVWRSRDCGESWVRLRDRPVFSVGRRAIELNGVRAAATAETLLVLGPQACSGAASRSTRRAVLACSPHPSR